jgi:hypothetical protein
MFLLLVFLVSVLLEVQPKNKLSHGSRDARRTY